MVTKVPRFTFEKYPQAEPVLGTQMKSVGEAMAMGRTFKESLQKAMRSLEIDRMGFDESDQAVDIVGGDGNALGIYLDPWIAGGGIELGAAWRLCQLPAQRMFAAPRPDEQDIHGSPFSRYGVRRRE